MARPPLEVADVIRTAGPDFLDRYRVSLTSPQRKVLRAIQRCRTAELGGHIDSCPACGHQAISYNSCRNRHCPKCQAGASRRWLAARQGELLPTSYSHVVFTLPHELIPVTLQNKRVVYDLLFRASAQTLLEVAGNPKHLGAEIGFFTILHTWNQKLEFHPHVHCVVAAGGLSPDHKRWIAPRHNFFLPVRILSTVFRGKFIAGLREAFQSGALRFYGSLRAFRSSRVFQKLIRQLFSNTWVVYSKKPFGGPEHALKYLSRYTHRIAISNHRLVSLESGRVTFRWRDSAHKNKQRLLTLKAEEFLRRLLLHVLPPSFVRIRHFGFLAHRHKRLLLPVCRQLLATRATVVKIDCSSTVLPTATWACPQCGTEMRIIERLTAAQLMSRSPPERTLPAE